MTVLSASHDYSLGKPTDGIYLALRCLFDCAVHSSLSDAPVWRLDGTYTDPMRLVMTRYYHRYSNETIECESSLYDEETHKYRLHRFEYVHGENQP